MKRFLCLMAMMGVLGISAQRLRVGELGSGMKLDFPILGGELSNSAATSVEDIDEVIPRMRASSLH